MSCFHISAKGAKCSKKSVDNRLCATHLKAVQKAKDKYYNDMETVPEKKQTAKYKTTNTRLSDDPFKITTYSKGKLTANLHKTEEGMYSLK